MTTPNLEVIERIENTLEVEVPKMYKVILFNDNKTSVEFVMHVLMRIFHKSTDESIALTQQIHEKGQGIAGAPYTAEVAEEKTVETMASARANNFPLTASFEEV